MTVKKRPTLKNMFFKKIQANAQEYSHWANQMLFWLAPL